MRKKSLLLMLMGAALGMMLLGCGHKDSGVEGEEKVAEMPGATQAAGEDEAAETPVPTEAGEEDGSEETNKEGKYDVVIDKKIQIDGRQERFRILANPDSVEDVKMTVGKDAVKLDRVSINSRSSAATKVKVRDCTGDGKEDIVLVLHGGASAACNDLQVLAKEKKKWKEVPFPEELWEEDFISFERIGKKMKIGVPGTKEEVIDDPSGDEWGTMYRLCKIGKDGQLSIVYLVYRGDDINNTVGKVKLTMRYDRAAKAFKIGKATFSF